MIGRISRFAEALNARANIGSDASSIGDVAVDVQLRKPTAQLMDMTAPAMDRRGVQYESYRGIIYAAVDKIAKRVCQMPIRLWQIEHTGDQKPNRTEIYTHPFLQLFHPDNGRKPHEEYSVWELDYTTQVSLDLTGEAWWLVERDLVGRPSRITPLPANRMTVLFDAKTGLTCGYKFHPKNSGENDAIVFPKFTWEELQTTERGKPFIVFHRYPSPMGIEDARGWSPVKAAAYSYDINLFEKVYKRNFLQNGAQLGGILQSETALSKDQIEEYLHQFQSRYSGARKAGIPMVLPKMLKWTTTEPTPRDIQWVETVKQTDSDILQIYGISDAKLGRADIGNRSTAEAMDVTFNREVIQSRLDVRIQKLNTDFLPIYPKQTPLNYFSCGYDDPVPSDGEMALKREDQDLKNNLQTRNEIRVARGMKPMGKFGDAVYAQENNNFFDASSDTLEDIRQPGAMDNFQADQADKANKAKADLAKAGVQDPNEPPPPKSGKKDDNKTTKKGARSGDPLTSKIYTAIIAHMSDDDLEQDMLAEVSSILSDAIREQVANVTASLGDAAEGSVDTEALVEEFLRTLETQIAGINNTTTEAIRSIILKGIADGETIQDIASDIDDLFDIADRVRSFTIARTETLGALNYAAYKSFNILGVPFKRWLTVMDGRERETHGEANGQTVPVNARFSVGGTEMDYPGDPSAPASEVINCRCTVAPEYHMEGRSVPSAQERKYASDFDTLLDSTEHSVRTVVRQIFASQKQRVLHSLGAS